MTYNFDKKMQTANFTVEVDTAACYGHFEHNECGDERGGGLWFEVNIETHRVGSDRILELVDYDGVACLPLEVSGALIDAGFVVNEEFR